MAFGLFKKKTEGPVAVTREQAASHYVKMRRKRERKKVYRGIFAALFALLLVGVAWGAGYINRINEALHNGLDDNLWGNLSIREAGQPFYMLLLGIDKDEGRVNSADYGSDDSAYRSDSLMLVRIDPEHQMVTLVSIHRDTLVDLPGYGQDKINASYSYGGASFAVDVIEDFCGVEISHYAEVDMDRFTDIVDQVGGIDVNLPVEVYDPIYTKLDLPAGPQHIDGRTAALLCRARHAYDAYGDGDVYRAANQRMVIGAIVKKVLRTNPAVMTTLIETMAESVTTDLDVQTILSLAMEMRGLDVDNNVYSAMSPTGGIQIDGIWYELVDEELWDAMMERVRAGLPPLTDDDVDQTEGIAAQSAE